jgi:glycosyltransferase involved in cell wall biosynthesis
LELRRESIAAISYELSMRVAILSVQVPFVRGGAEYLAESLHHKLVEFGHQAELINIPYRQSPYVQLLQGMVACRLLKLDASRIDLVIALKFPAYVVPFVNKKLWLLHQLREVYDLWGTSFSGIHITPEGTGLRDAISRADTHYLGEVKAIYTISSVVAKRLERYNHIRANGVLYPPLLSTAQFQPGDFGDYFLFPSRINELKRQLLAVEAMRYVKSDFKLVLVGKPDQEKHLAHLRSLIDQYDIGSKVRILGYVSDEEKIKLCSNAYGFVYVPYDEDYGYVTLEAFCSGKPVITAKDSGGPRELIRHGENGLVSEPSPQALAQSMEDLWATKQRAMAMGQAALASMETFNLNWAYVLERLLS